MRLRTRLERLSSPSAVAIGNFDGLHAGHRRILALLAAEARRRRLLSVVLTFRPHPRIALGQRVPLISTDAQRLQALQAQDLDRLYFIDFAAVAALPAAAFVRDVLLAKLQARLLVVGGDFRFGRGREGDLARLRRETAGRCVVLRAPEARRGGRRVASSRIRRLLAAGDVAAAGRMLTRPYFIDGVVVRGAGRGTRLGFPTMNIASDNALLPPGVFHTLLELGGRRYTSATFIGSAPTFARPGEAPGAPRVETHVPGFRGQVYGRRVRLHFVSRLRRERKFAGAEALAAQIARDVAALGI